MNTNTLELLGMSAEELGDRIIDRAVEVLLSGRGFDPEDGEETRYETKFKKEIDARIQRAVDAKISSLAEIHLIPRVSELIEKADLHKTNRFGEPLSGPLTFKEYLAERAEKFMIEDVNYLGKSKAELEAKGESTYDWRSAGPRLTVLMKLHIKDSLEKVSKEALVDVNKAIATSIQNAAKTAITQAANALKISISV